MAIKIKGAIFDNDNTIAKIYPNPKIYWEEVFLETVRQCGGRVPEGRETEFMLSYYSGKGFAEKLSEIGLQTGWDEFQAAKGSVDTRKRVAFIKEGNSYLFPDAVKFLQYLDTNGIKFGVATFTSHPVVMAEFDAVPSLPRPAAFYGWEDSLKLGYEKPNPAIAHAILEQLGALPREAIMVGDRLTDVELGNTAGMTTILVKRTEEDGKLVGETEREIEEIRGNMARLEDFKKIPDYQVNLLTEIIPLLED